MASNRKSRLPSSQRDPLTGEQLHRNTARAALLDHDPNRHRLHRTPVPLRIHVSQEETVERDGTEGDLSERLGSHALARPMVHYIAEGERSERRIEKEWWWDQYICDRLATHAGPRPAPFTHEQLTVGLAWQRGEDIADWGYSDRFIKYAALCIEQLAKTYTPRLERAA